jgi:O-succinylhomoserine sulfhydrylase
MAKDPSDETAWRLATRLVRGGTRRSGFDETSEALFMTSGFVYGSAAEAEAAFKGERDRFVYSRFANPTVQMFERRLALLEGAALCRATATGMSAVFTALACGLRAGDRLVASRALFGSCHYVVSEILPGFGIRTELVDGRDNDAWRRALATPAACVFLETPSNPMLEIVDLEVVCELAHAAGARVVVDNVFATPILQRPLTFGAHVVVYSATKHIDGQGRALGGAILTDDAEWFEQKLVPFHRHTGPSLSPFNAWLLLKGLETLELRMQRHCSNARAVAHHLAGRNDLQRVLHPSLPGHPQHAVAMRQMRDGGSLVTLDVAGGRERAYAFLDGLRVFDISNNLGDAKSLATHPATTTHQRFTPEQRAEIGIFDNTVRLSIGLEDEADLIEDLDQALRRAA